MVGVQPALDFAQRSHIPLIGSGGASPCQFPEATTSNLAQRNLTGLEYCK